MTPGCCNCPAWTYRPDSRPCKHVAALRDALAVVKAVVGHWQAIGGAVDVAAWLEVSA